MTGTELDALEAKAKAATPGPWELDAEADTTVDNQIVRDGIYISAANPNTVLSLIAELRQTRKERDWLVQTLEDEQYCYPGPRMEGGILTCEEKDMWCDKCDRYSKEHWLNAAKEVTSCRES